MNVRDAHAPSLPGDWAAVVPFPRHRVRSSKMSQKTAITTFESCPQCLQVKLKWFAQPAKSMWSGTCLPSSVPQPGPHKRALLLLTPGLLLMLFLPCRMLSSSCPGDKQAISHHLPHRISVWPGSWSLPRLV